MHKSASIVRAVVMATALAGIAPAHADQWDISFNDLQHFHDDYSGNVIDYGAVTLKGVLYTEDVNHNHRIDAGEVQFLTLGSYGFSSDQISSLSFSGNRMYVNANGFRVVLNSSGLFYASGGYADSFRAGPASYLTVTALPVPEPATLALMSVGLLGLTGYCAVRRVR